MMGNQITRGFLATLSLLPAISGAIPTTSELPLSGGLTILSYNDLTNAPVAGAGAILLGQSEVYASASTACNLLNEDLWVPIDTAFYGGLNNSLSNQIFEGLYASSQLFWVGANSSSCKACNAIDVKGSVYSVPCTLTLPVLCTQSALVSSKTVDNTSAVFQVTHQVARQQLTGYRDYYTWKFRGVRFAPEPDRFEYSTVLDDTGSHSALVAGPDCLQPSEASADMSDDCLFLNIWTPHLPPSAGAPAARLKPVALYIFGGGFTTGSGNNPNQDGTNMASRGDVVVVSLNYRLGNLGFLAFNDSIHNGNYAIGDMVTALEWISKNIKYFGGDPARVTIFGESAGASAVHDLLASPKAKGLFSNAIMESDPGGPFTEYFVEYMSVEKSYETYTLSVLSEAGCNVSDAIGCLRALNGTTLATLSTVASAPVEDHFYLVTDELILNNTSGYGKDVNVISGTNRDEAGILAPYPPDGITVDEWLALLLQELVPGSKANFTPILDSGLFPYPPNPDPAEIFNLTSRMLTDLAFLCMEQSKIYTAAKHSAFKSLYTYTFNRTYSPHDYTNAECNATVTADHPYGDPNLEYYKCHGAELPMVFGTVARIHLPFRDDFDLPFQQLAMDYWTTFFWTGNPNPDPAALEARGYWNTLAQTQAVGPWDQVDPNNPGTHWLQWNGLFIPYSEIEQCAALSWPITTYETS